MSVISGIADAAGISNPAAIRAYLAWSVNSSMTAPSGSTARTEMVSRFTLISQ